jgi:dienelactone hydrolase
MQERVTDYDHDGVRLCGLAFVPAHARETKLPGVLIAHDWRGRHQFAIDQARAIAAEGFITLAIDMYGDAKVGTNLQENIALSLPFQQDRGLMMARVNAALAALKAIPEVNSSRTAAVGFCFGGMCVLDLARSGADVQGVVAMHGLLSAPPAAISKPIRAKVLVLHGFKDPMATPEQLVALGHELTALGADWQAHAYGNAAHAFTNPVANDAARGTIYDELTCSRAFRSTHAFFAEIFSTPISS